MAEDKKIRVSADLSQMRSLRDEASSLYRDMIQFTNEQNRLTEQSLEQLREQLQLLGRRNDLEELYAELKRKTNSISPRQENSFRTENNRSERGDSIQPRRDVENIDERITNRRVSQDNLQENIQNINRTTENIEEHIINTQRDKIQSESEPPISSRDNNYDVIDQQRDQSSNRNYYEDRREKDRFNESRVLDDSINKLLEEISQRIVIVPNDLINPRIREVTKSVNSVESRLASIIDIILSMDENLAIMAHGGDSPDHDNRPSVAPVPVPTPAPTTPTTDDSDNRRKRDDERRDRNWGIGGNSVARVISGVGSMAISDPISAVGQGISMAGGLGGELAGAIGSAFGPIGSAIGNTVGGALTAAANVFSSYITTTAQKAIEFQRTVVPYSQTMGVSNAQAIATASREGGYAASALGMNSAEYLQRRAQLIRSAGGKEETVAPVQETQSLMAAERQYGIQGVDSLQAVMRFALDESTKSSSAIIRSIEMTMKDLRKPFSEIASTMDESLSTFTKTADEVLSKTGEIDATKIAATMRTVRLTTDMEGRQLERVQQAAMGIGLSQDDVTQAYLHRAVQQTKGPNMTTSEMFAIEENLTEHPDVMRNLMDLFQQASGGVNEQFIQLLKGAFPGLSYNDILGWTKSGYFDREKAVQDIQARGEQALAPENDRINRYSPTEAAETVGSGEQMMKNFENWLAEKGIGNLQKINDIYTFLHDTFGDDKKKDPMIQVAEKGAEIIQDTRVGKTMEEVGQSMRVNHAENLTVLFKMFTDWVNKMGE